MIHGIQFLFPELLSGTAAMSESISSWIERLRHSDPQAAARLWEQFFERMVAVARQRLGDRPRRAGDEEDAALSAFADFTRAMQAGRFPDLRDRDGLWALLLSFTENKAREQRRDEQRQRRGGGRPALPLTGEMPDDAPPPDEVAAFQDQLAWLLGQLVSDEVRQVALLRLQGHGNDEIALRMGCSRATVERRIRLVRESWGWLTEQEKSSPP
jgi:DNA-directed RNA polymerase specialized sigma24 family protein